MSGSQYPTDVQFAGLIQAATAAADAQERNTSSLGKRRRSQDDSLIDTQLRIQQDSSSQSAGQLPPNNPGLQSAAAVLFREPSEKSKKYSRPPLGKVYADLQLAPENFLRLQNAAKQYMLDEDHYERRDVVGHKKHSGNNDVAKLRLWACVEDFMNQDNNGETWFGHGAGTDIPDAPQRTFFWPEDRHKITKLCMPLFRKMVTNERQRVYASETRKQDSNKHDKKSSDAAMSPVAKDTALPLMPNNDASVIDQTLELPNANQTIYSIEDQQQQLAVSTAHLLLHINIVNNNDGTLHRLVPRFTVPAQSVTTLPALMTSVRKKYDIVRHSPPSTEDDWFVPAIKVWLPDGLVRIKDDAQWMLALLNVSMVEWMDSEIRVMIEVKAPEMVTVK